jgi:hypothetical protein
VSTHSDISVYLCIIENSEIHSGEASRSGKKYSLAGKQSTFIIFGCRLVLNSMRSNLSIFMMI